MYFSIWPGYLHDYHQLQVAMSDINKSHMFAAKENIGKKKRRN